MNDFLLCCNYLPSSVSLSFLYIGDERQSSDPDYALSCMGLVHKNVSSLSFDDADMK